MKNKSTRNQSTQNESIQNVSSMRAFWTLHITQSLSALGSSMTSFALILWAFRLHSSALETALLSVCSYTPYVLTSVFSGTLSDRIKNKKAVMLASDLFAAVCTLCTLLLFRADLLLPWHLYVLNALNGLMNSVQRPAADVAASLLAPREKYQKVGAAGALSNSIVTLLTPVLASGVLAACSMQAVFWIDLATFAAAFLTLLLFVRIPCAPQNTAARESVRETIRSGFSFLAHNRGILDLMLFLAAINFTASVYNAALPVMMLSHPAGGQQTLAAVQSTAGAALLIGGALAAAMPRPKSRVRVICNTLLLSMGTENLLLAFGASAPVWCLGAILGWIGISPMNANLDALLRSNIPLAMQGRVYAVRNALQFFTIPIGYLTGGLFIDRVLVPFMARQTPESLLCRLFGTHAASASSLLFFFLWLTGLLTCLLLRCDKHILSLERIDSAEEA